MNPPDDKKIDSLKHQTPKRLHIPSKEEESFETHSDIVAGKKTSEIPLNPVTHRGQDPELYWMHKYGEGDEQTHLGLLMTIGSGAITRVADQWSGRRITPDTSRIALNITKMRLMTTTTAATSWCGGDHDEFDKWKKGLSDLAKQTTKRKVEQTLKIEIDEEAFDRVYGFQSHPIPQTKGRKVAVRVISQFGEESTKVLSL